MKIIGIGCGTVLALIIVVVVISAVAVSRNGTTKALLTGNASDVTVQVTGSTGLKFSGAIGGGSSERSVDGTIPASFPISGNGSSGIFVANAQKQDQDGVLTISIIGCPDGGTHTQTTSAAYGVATVSC